MIGVEGIVCFFLGILAGRYMEEIIRIFKKLKRDVNKIKGVKTWISVP